MQELKGTGVALVTPFKNDLSVDITAFHALINHCINGGIDYMVIMGTTAENATLKASEKERIIQTAVEATSGRVPLVLGIGGNNTQALCDEVSSRDLSGYTAILSVSPYYNRPSQAGIYAHYKAFAEACPLPIILYNVPARTGSNMLPDTVFKLAKDFENIIGIKEASGDMVQMLRLLQQRPKGFMVISGDDMLALPTVAAGGDGVISVLAQGMPKELTGMINDSLSGDFKAANKAHFALMPFIDAIFAEGNPAGIKALLSLKGVCTDAVRLPLVKATNVLSNSIATLLGKS